MVARAAAGGGRRTALTLTNSAITTRSPKRHARARPVGLGLRLGLGLGLGLRLGLGLGLEGRSHPAFGRRWKRATVNGRT